MYTFSCAVVIFLRNQAKCKWHCTSCLATATATVRARARARATANVAVCLQFKFII